MIGSSFNLFFPSLLFVLILINYYELYSKILRFLGMKQFEFRSNFNSSEIENGKILVDNERDGKEYILDQYSQLKQKHGFIKNVLSSYLR